MKLRKWAGELEETVSVYVCVCEFKYALTKDKAGAK